MIFFTLQHKIHAGKEAYIEQLVSTKVILQPSEPYLDEGRCHFVDNWYTRMDLAEKVIRLKILM